LTLASNQTLSLIPENLQDRTFADPDPAIELVRLLDSISEQNQKIAQALFLPNQKMERT